MLLKKYKQCKNQAMLDQLQGDLPHLVVKLKEVQKQLGKLLTYHPCTSVPVADLFLS